jgi:hypothetical protein
MLGSSLCLLCILAASTVAFTQPRSDSIFIIDNDDELLERSFHPGKRSEMPSLSNEQMVMILRELKNARKNSAFEDADAEGVSSLQPQETDDRGSPLSFGTDLDALSTMLASRLIGKHGRLRSVRHRLSEIGKK